MDEIDRPPIRVYPRPAIERDGWLRQSALVEGLPGGDALLWFDCEPRHAEVLTPRADPWVPALLFSAMEHGSSLTVDGEVSTELLANLEAFQATWRLWGDGRYRPVKLAATSEVADPRRPLRDTDPALMAFGGGLDDCYTAWKHARRLAGRQTLAIRAGLTVVGLPHLEGEGSGSAMDKARALLADLDVDLWTVRTNAAQFIPAWEHASGAALAACLHWYSRGMAVGVLAGPGTVSDLRGPRGSHPLTDHQLSSDRMRIVHDGAEQDFALKARALATWQGSALEPRADSEPREALPKLARLGAGPPPTDPSAPRKRSTDRPRPRTVHSPFVWARAPRATDIHVFPEPAALEDGQGVLSARVEGLGAKPRWIRFSVETRHAEHLTSLADPFACALQFPAMRAGATLAIHGPVSRALLRNLEQFQEVWHTWAPEYVTPVPMCADEEVEATNPVSDETLMLFSGGADSSFSVYRHHQKLAGRRSRRIAAGLMVRGFDIPHDEVAEFRAAFENSRRMLESLAIDLWSMATNFREIVGDWEPAHGTAIAACVHCLGGRFGTALVAATAVVTTPDSPWGTHILTDRLLSSDRIQVMTDGEDVPKLDKIVLLAEWPEAMRRLRVCFESPRRDRNCGECAKCLLTALMFLANGLPLPVTLRRPDPGQVRNLPLRAGWEARVIRRLLARGRAVGVTDEAWFPALLECLSRYEAAPGAFPAARPLWVRARRRLARALRRRGR